MPKYFDIHSHLNFGDYDKDWDEVILRLRESETHTIVVGTDYKSSKRAVELAEKYPEIYACIGVHPVDNPTRVFERKVVAIGECGLDFFHAKKAEDYERQKALFVDQVAFALELGKPLMIHARDAYPELLEILEPLKKEHGEKLRGNIHFFAGDSATAERFFAIGFTVSFTGVITFTASYDEVIKKAPLGMIMAETDAPFVAPAPYRGKRNEPSYVKEVVRRIAEIRGEDLELVRRTLVNNALAMVGY
ncbi:TatD family hydrolase [Candidatus Parcubacteria bacterium]|nr:TatD family hydrolase [Candidatus Parcubacteria bacterium]